MLIKKDQRSKKQISDDGFVYEYPNFSKDLGMAFSELNGRIPDRGLMKNNLCDEVYYVVSGSANIFIDDTNYEINEGDIFYFPAGKSYYVEANNLILVIPTRPAFYPEQWQNIKD